MGGAGGEKGQWQGAFRRWPSLRSGRLERRGVKPLRRLTTQVTMGGKVRNEKSKVKSNLNTRPLNAKPKQKNESIQNKEFAYPHLFASRCSVLAIDAGDDTAALIRLSAKQRPYRRLQVHSWTRMCLRNVDAASQSSAKDSRKLFRNSLHLAACRQPEGTRCWNLHACVFREYCKNSLWPQTRWKNTRGSSRSSKKQQQQGRPIHHQGADCMDHWWRRKPSNGETGYL